MDWTIFWTIFGTIFWTILSRGKHTIRTQGGVGCSLSVLREGWDAVYQYWGRAGRHSHITQGGVRDGLWLRRKGWEVVVTVNTTCQWSFYSIIHIILIDFSTDFFKPKFLRWAAVFLPFFCHANAKLPLKHWTLIVIEYIASTILHCWVMRLAFEQNCAPSVSSRFLLCIQYIITKFFCLTFVIDLSRRDHGIFG